MNRYRALSFAVLTSIAFAGCRSQEPAPEPSEQQQVNPEPKPEVPQQTEKPQFKTMEFHAKVEKFETQKDGKLVFISSGALTMVVDALANKSRVVVKATNPADDELTIFDGVRMWQATPAEKAIYGYMPLWQNFVVWNEIPPTLTEAPHKESLRGKEMSVAKYELGTFWYYKGVNVQFERVGPIVVKTTLQDIREDVTVSNKAFDLPSGLTKVQY